MDILSRYSGTRMGGLVTTVLGRIHASFVTAGRILVMSASSLRYLVSGIVRGEFQYKEFISQAWFVVGVAVVPTLLVAVPFGVIISIQIGSLAQQVGATSFIGAANGLGVIRQGAPIVVALLLAGAVGSAICADLGARTIREEIDALEVLGVSPIQRLIVPRVLAVIAVAVLLNGLVSVVGVAGGYYFNVVMQGGTPGAYLASFNALAQLPDLWVSEIKAVIYGFVAGIVAAYRGLNPGRGPKGVGDAVNQTVVITFLLLFLINVVITGIYLQIVPPKGM